MYFGNYRRLVYLSQTDDPALVERGRAAAFLGLAFEHRRERLRRPRSRSLTRRSWSECMG